MKVRESFFGEASVTPLRGLENDAAIQVMSRPSIDNLLAS
jgi:hypothetical protein